jgi:hypothetical protein
LLSAPSRLLPRPRWAAFANDYAERWVRTVRRECLDRIRHVLNGLINEYSQAA